MRSILHRRPAADFYQNIHNFYPPLDEIESLLRNFRVLIMIVERCVAESKLRTRVVQSAGFFVHVKW